MSELEKLFLFLCLQVLFSSISRFLDRGVPLKKSSPVLVQVLQFFCLKDWKIESTIFPKWWYSKYLQLASLSLSFHVAEMLKFHVVLDTVQWNSKSWHCVTVSKACKSVYYRQFSLSIYFYCLKYSICFLVMLKINYLLFTWYLDPYFKVIVLFCFVLFLDRSSHAILLI